MAAQMRGPPYPSTTAGLGGLPNTKVDVPATAVFLALYLSFAVTNMTILQINLRRKHIKFIISGALFGFCMARTATCVLRIAWATRQTNVRLAMAANIFINAGILIVYVVNIIFAQRILRAKQPQLGWNRIVRTVPKMLYALIGVALAGVITAVVLSAYSISTHVRQICRDIQLAAVTYLFVFNLLPWLFLAAAYLLPKSPNEEHFGQGSMNKKALVVLASSCLCVLIAGFKTGILWHTPRPASQPAWFDSKACFYVFTFGLEIAILLLLTASRVDKLFYVPDGCNAPGDYTSRRVNSSRTSDSGDVEEQKS